MEQIKTPQGDNSTYIDHRNVMYPTIQEQLDILYHEGYDGWKTVIQSVKDQYPKPEVN